MQVHRSMSAAQGCQAINVHKYKDFKIYIFDIFLYIFPFYFYIFHLSPSLVFGMHKNMSNCCSKGPERRAAAVSISTAKINLPLLKINFNLQYSYSKLCGNIKF